MGHALDRGLLSEVNFKAIREHQGHYLAGTPRARLGHFGKQPSASSWERVRADVEMRMIANEDRPRVERLTLIPDRLLQSCCRNTENGIFGRYDRLLASGPRASASGPAVPTGARLLS